MSELDRFRHLYQKEVQKRREEIVVIHRIGKIDNIILEGEKIKAAADTAEFCLNNSEPSLGTNYLENHWKEQVHERACLKNELEKFAIELQELLTERDSLEMVKRIQEAELADTFSLERDSLEMVKKIEAEFADTFLLEEIKPQEEHIEKADTQFSPTKLIRVDESLLKQEVPEFKVEVNTNKFSLGKVKANKNSHPTLIKTYSELTEDLTATTTEWTYFKRYGWNELYWIIVTKEELDDEPLLVPPNYEIQFDSEFNIFNFPLLWSTKWIKLTIELLQKKISEEEFCSSFNDITNEASK